MKMTTPAHLRKIVTLAALPEGVEGIKATLALMVKLARQGKQDFAVRDKALSIVEGLRQKDWLGEVRAVQEFVRDHVRYVKDINGIETLATPVQTLQSMQGDCDDKSLLTAALLETLGHPSRFVAVGSEPSQFVHVLVETRIHVKKMNGKGVIQWIPVETTEPVPIGWYPRGMTQRLVYNI